MDRPLVYRDSYVVNRNLPYEMVELLPSGEYHGGGVLGKGQRVWMQHEPQGTTCDQAVSVYAEDVGIINLDPHCLSRLDAKESTAVKESADQSRSAKWRSVRMLPSGIVPATAKLLVQAG